MTFPRLYLSMLLAASLLILTAGCERAPAAPDFSDYQLWAAKSDNAVKADQLLQYLRREGVDQVIPLHQLLRSDVKWKKCGAGAFEVPPKANWPHIVPTLRIVRDEIVPVVGPVEALSVFRSPEINKCIKGASHSFHLGFHAIDMRPVKKISRDELAVKLCKLYREEGKKLKLGLGVYVGTRFHIDAAGRRTWGADYHSSTSPCRSNVALQRNMG